MNNSSSKTDIKINLFRSESAFSLKTFLDAKLKKKNTQMKWNTQMDQKSK